MTTIKTVVSKEFAAVVLFDGDCNFCNASVRFIVQRDPQAIFGFAPLTSSAAQQLLQQQGITEAPPGTMILIEKDRVSTRSTASLRIARQLRFPWWLFYYGLIWIPAPIRDVVYDAFARRRYRWFGAAACPIEARHDVESRMINDESDVYKARAGR